MASYNINSITNTALFSLEEGDSVAANHPRPKVWSNYVFTNASFSASPSVYTNVERSAPIVTRSSSDPTHSVFGIRLPYGYSPKRNKDVLKLLNKLSRRQVASVMKRGFVVRNGDLDDKQLKTRIRELREQFNLPKPDVKIRWQQASQLKPELDATSPVSIATRVKFKKRRMDKTESKGDREHEVFQASRDKLEAFDEVSDQLVAERNEAYVDLAESMSSGQ
jgi:hypothetical protein